MVSQWLKAIRPLNLSIVALYQALLYYKLYTYVEATHLSLAQIVGLIVATLCITAGGYLINDYFDIQADQLNSKQKADLDTNQLRYAYFGTTVFGLAVAIWIAIGLDQLYYIVLYPAAVLLLYVYSAWAKGVALLGNILVAVFCSCSFLIVLLAEQPSLALLKGRDLIAYEQVSHLFLALSIFAGILTLIREIVKDVEDIVGDKAVGLRTFPIVVGLLRTKKMLYFYWMLLLLLSVGWTVYCSGQYAMLGWWFFVGVIGIGELVLGYSIWQAAFLTDYTQLSKQIKGLMLLSVVYLVLC